MDKLQRPSLPSLRVVEGVWGEDMEAGRTPEPECKTPGGMQ
jgi:hypothetical protein